MKLKVLGREITVNKAATSTDVQSYQPTFWQSFGSSAVYKFGDAHDWVSDYFKCPPLKSIIDKLNTAFTNGNTIVVNKSTLKPAMGVQSIQKILEQPNSIQTQTQFEAVRNTYLTLYGWAIVMKFKPNGFENDPLAVTSRWVLPNEDLEIKWSKSPFYTTSRKNLIQSIKYNVGGISYPLNPKDCFIYTHLNASYVDGGALPSSPLCGLEYPIGNIIKAYKATGNLLENNGALGILSNDAVDKTVGTIPMISTEAKEQLQSDYRGYGHQNGQNKIIITSLALKWQQMSLPIKDLMLQEIKEEDTLAIADRLGYPKDLLNIGASRTYENANQAGVDLYQNTIMPQADHVYEQETMDLLEGTNFRIIADFDHVAALQEDEGRKAKASKDWSAADKTDWESNLLTRNQILERRDLPKIEGGDMYYTEWMAQFNIQPEEIIIDNGQA
jgi:hypothetical protein